MKSEVYDQLKYSMKTFALPDARFFIDYAITEGFVGCVEGITEENYSQHLSKESNLIG